MLYLNCLKNVVADLLSRPPPQPVGFVTAAEASPINFEAMATEQNRCPEKQRLLRGSSVNIAFHHADAQPLVGNISTGVIRTVVPEKF
jgi:hypothetical protein